jgi:hypothetical protein
VKHRLTKVWIKSSIAVIAIVAVACIDMSAPKGTASISALLLPSPSVVVGDMMRDSNGVPAPITLVGYDGAGAPIAGLTSQFFFTDSVHYAHLSSGNVLVGDSVGLAHIVGQIGTVQTDVTPITVTLVPDSFFVQAKPDSIIASLGADSSSSLGLAQLSVSLRSATQAAVVGFRVIYTLVSAPVSSATASSPAVFLMGDASKGSLVDTTDASGNASRTLVVNVHNLGDADLIEGKKIDSAVVKAAVFYKGLHVKGSPLTFVVPIRVP